MIDFPTRVAIAWGALALGGAALAPAWGQVRGIPVHNAGVFPGIGLAGEVGFPGDGWGGGTAYGGTLMVGVGRVGLSASIATQERAGGAGGLASYGGTLGLKLLGSPLTPLLLTLQAGYAHWTDAGTGTSHVPVGLGIALALPIPGIGIRPWLAPRADLTTAAGGSGSATATRFGISGGVDVTLLSGFGLRAAYDRISLEGQDPTTFAIGAHYLIKVPGL